MDVARDLVRPTIVDGLFYPADRTELREAVAALLEASPVPPGACFGVLSPHAALACAGEVIAAAFRAIALREVRTAVLLGPVHRDLGPGRPFLLPESRWFATPLGEVAVDGAAVDALAACEAPFLRNDIPHLEEHCLEVQLPFLQHLFPDAAIVPVLVADETAAAAAALARSLELTFQNAWDYTVVVASANLASYLRGGGTETEYRALRRLVAVRDWHGVAEAAGRREVSACGPSVIAALLALAGEQARIDILAEGDSREADAGPDRIVRYAAVGVRRGTGGGAVTH